MTDGMGSLGETIGLPFCARCDAPVQDMTVAPEAARDGVTIHVSCHGESQDLFLTSGEIVNRTSDTVLHDVVSTRLTILHAAPFSLADHSQEIPGQSSPDETFQQETPQEGSTAVEAEAPQVTAEIPTSYAWATEMIRGQAVTLDEMAATFTRCRNLVSGLPVNTLFIEDEDFAALLKLIMAATATTPDGFHIRTLPEHGNYVAWRQMRLYPAAVKPWLVQPGSLDATSIPLLYTNQAGTVMSFWPPWVSQTGSVQTYNVAYENVAYDDAPPTSLSTASLFDAPLSVAAWGGPALAVKTKKGKKPGASVLHKLLTESEPPATTGRHIVLRKKKAS